MKLETLCPPYEGDQAFAFLCVAEADANRVQPLLARLCSRGCRIWYPTGHGETVAERERRNARMSEARLVILYQTARARADQVVKSAVLVCQAKQIPIISIDTDSAESTLSMGLDPHAVHLRANRPDAIEAALLHADGFSQELIGPPQTVGKRRLFGVAIAVLALSLALVGAAVLYRYLRPPAVVRTDDTVFFSDPALTRAVRDALDGGAITEASLETVAVLRLSAVPSDTDELLLLPNLSRIELDQSGAGDALPLLDRYEVVLTGGGQ